MRIIIPLDGSSLAEAALAPAAQLAKQMQPPTEVVLVRIVRYPIMESGLLGPYPGMSSAEVLDDVLEVAHAYLHAATQLPIFKGLSVHTITEMGVPTESICALAQREHADLIMLTSHGRAGLGRLVLGSVAEAVARDAHIPVLIVRPQGETFPDIGRFAPLTILVPLDGTPLSEAAIAPAAMLARAFHGALSLTRILSATPASTDVTAQEAFAYLTVFHDQLAHEGITVHRSLGWGDPAEQIVAKAQEHRADIVALATHGRTPLAQLVQGSVAATVLHHMTLPLLVVYPTPAAYPMEDSTQSLATTND